MGPTNGHFPDPALKQQHFLPKQTRLPRAFPFHPKRGVSTAGTAEHLLVRPSDQGRRPGPGAGLRGTASAVPEGLHAGTARVDRSSCRLPAATETAGLKHCRLFSFQKRYITEITLPVGD